MRENNFSGQPSVPQQFYEQRSEHCPPFAEPGDKPATFSAFVRLSRPQTEISSQSAVLTNEKGAPVYYIYCDILVPLTANRCPGNSRMSMCAPRLDSSGVPRPLDLFLKSASMSSLFGAQSIRKYIDSWVLLVIRRERLFNTCNARVHRKQRVVRYTGRYFKWKHVRIYLCGELYWIAI